MTLLLVLWLCPSFGVVLLGFWLADDSWKQARYERRRAESRETLRKHGGRQP